MPPFTAESAAQKVRLAEDAWNSRDPERVALAYVPDSRWRNRSEFISGRQAIVAFLQRKWTRELDYRLVKEVWAFGENRASIVEIEDDGARKRQGPPARVQLSAGIGCNRSPGGVPPARSIARRGGWCACQRML